MKKIKRTKQICPKCKSDRVLPIEYGLVNFQPEGVWLGGCCIIEGESPKWHCEKCGYEWGKYFSQ